MNTDTSVVLLTYSDASRRLAISLRQLRRLVDSGKLPVVRVTERAPRIRLCDIEAFIRATMSVACVQ